MASPVEPNLGGTGSFFGARGGGSKRNNAAKLGAKVSVQGVRDLVSEMNQLLGVLRNVRQEYEKINKLSGKTGATSAIPGATGAQSRFAGMVSGFQANGGGGGMIAGLAGNGIGGGMIGGGMVAGGAVVAGAGYMLGRGFSRMDNVMMQSAAISARNSLTASMYGSSYRDMEMNTLRGLGRFAGTREQAAAAQQIGLSLGLTPQNNTQFMRTVGNVVQASGGTLNSAQAAATAGSFTDAGVMRRAISMGVTPGRLRGVVQNPLELGKEYIQNYEKRVGRKLNKIDFTNMMSSGNSLRYTFMRLYGLTDEHIEVIVQAGMQNLSAGGSLDFNDPSALSAAGLNTNRLGLQMTNYTSAVSRRDAGFFQRTEGSMVGRLGTEITIQETLGKVEQAFGGVLGKLYEFERVLQAVTFGVGAMGGINMLMGGGGLGGGMMGGAARGGGGILGALGRGGPMGGMGRMGAATGGLLGAAGVIGGTMVANRSSLGAASVPVSGIMAGGGAALMGASGPLAIGIGAGMATYAAVKYFGNVDKTNVSKGFSSGMGMDDAALISSIQDYVKNGGFADGKGAGAKQRGRFDALARRRGALVAAALTSAQEEGLYGAMNSGKVSELINFFGSDNVFDDGKLRTKRSEVWPFLAQLKGTPIWDEYFGNVDTPFTYRPITTQQNQSLIMAGGAEDQTGDGPYDRGATAADSAKGPTWDRLDPRMKSRLEQLFAASGGKLWLGTGWRSEETQRSMFLSRYVQDPNGSVSWNGSRWRKVRGADAAPPGRSMHEIGMAADLVGDFNWLEANASRFGLKTFRNVNNEPWHVQLSELPNSRRDYEAGGGRGAASMDTGAAAAAGAAGAATAAAETAPSWVGGSSATARSGTNYSLAGAMGSTPTATGMRMIAGAGAATTAGSTAGPSSGGAWPTDEAARGAAVARVAYNAGFRGQDLLNMVGIAYRESRWNPSSWVVDSDDHGGGLWGINQLPWLRQGLTPPFSQADILDPQKNANIAYQMWSKQIPGPGGPYNPWKGYDAPEKTYPEKARQAVLAAGLLNGGGDGTFDTGMTGGGGSVSVSVQLISTGNAHADAHAIAASLRPAIEMVAAEVQMKRGS